VNSYRGSIRLVLVLSLLTLSVPCWADGPIGYTLGFTITNQSANTLTFDRFGTSTPGDKFTIQDRVLFPGMSTLATGSVPYPGHCDDLWGHLLFTDSKGHHLTLDVRDQRKCHYGQRALSADDSNYYSDSVIHTNTFPSPNSLMSTDASVTIYSR
jgi:hypothetical protein